MLLFLQSLRARRQEFFCFLATVLAYVLLFERNYQTGDSTKHSKVRRQVKSIFFLALALLLGFAIRPVLAKPAQMHIMEGFLLVG